MRRRYLGWALWLLAVVPALARFEIQSDPAVVLDTQTGLMWTRSTYDGADYYWEGSYGVIWEDAMSYCAGVTLGGHGDWRLPTLEELESLVDATQSNPALPPGHPFTVDLRPNYMYWASDLQDPGFPKCLWMENGLGGYAYSANPGFVWPVRGQLGQIVRLEYSASSEGGGICGETNQTIVCGGSGEPVVALPDAAHVFVEWSDGSTANPRRDIHVTSNIQVSARFDPRDAPPPVELSDSRFWVDIVPGASRSCDGQFSIPIPIARVVGEVETLIASGAMNETAVLSVMGCSPGKASWNAYISGPDGVERAIADPLTFTRSDWSVARVSIPVTNLVFPEDPGENGTVLSVIQTLRLEPVAPGAVENALALSKVEIEIEAAPPIFFVHGILSKGDTWEAMRRFVAEELGLPTDPITMPDVMKLASMEANAGHIRDRVQMLKMRWGVDRVNIVAHSKGGLDAKHYVMGPGFQDDVMHLIQIATPNGGSPTADKLRLLADAASLILPWPTEAGRQLRTDYMSAYNRVWQERFRLSPVIVKTIAGDFRVPDKYGDLLSSWDCGGYRGETAPGRLCPAPWDNNEGRSLHDYCEKYGYALWLCHQYRADPSPYHVDEYEQYVHPNDLYVPVWSAYALGTAYPPGTARMSAGTNAAMSHVNIHQQREIFDVIQSDLIKPYDPEQAASAGKGKAMSIRSDGRPRKEAQARGVGEGKDRDDDPAYVYYDALEPLVSREYEFLVFSGNVVAFRAAGFRGYGEPAPHGDLQWSFMDPAGTVWTNSDSADGVHFEWPAEGGGPLRVMLDRPAAGAWTVRVHNASQTWTNAIRLEMTGLDDGVEVSAQLDEDRIPFGQPVVGRVELMREGLPVTGARVTGLIYDSESDAEFPIAALDDGAGADEVAGDGVYTVAFMPEEDGVYDVALSVRSDAEPVFMRRLRPLRAMVAEPGAAILGVQEEAVQDADGDGLHDRLILHLEVDVARAGRLHVSGNLLDAQGLVVAHAHEVFDPTTGVQVASLSFDGRHIYWAGEDGPYVLSDVQMTREYPSGELIVLAEATNLNATAAYSHRAFQHPPVQPAGDAAIMAADADEDGWYDRLNVQLGLIVQESLAGEAIWRAELVDGTGQVIARMEGTVEIGSPGGDWIDADLDGQLIGESGLNGPYRLQHLELWQGGQLLYVLANAGASPAYAAAEFIGYVAPLAVDIRRPAGTGAWSLGWPSRTGRYYNIEHAVDLCGGEWQVMGPGTNLPGSGAWMEVEGPVEWPGVAGFLRVVEHAAPWVPPGTLQVVLAPPEAVTAGAQWRIPAGAWQESGAVLSLASGPYPLEFAPVTGWHAPQEPAATVVDGQSTVIHAEYMEEGVLDDPGGLTAYRDAVGESFLFRVAGRTNDIIWGTDLYTDDSPLAVAAVHAGVLAAGETGVVSATLMGPQDSFVGTERNGVVSRSYGYWGGSYQVRARNE